MTAPVIYLAKGEARKATIFAISSGSPKVPAGMFRAMKSLRASSVGYSRVKVCALLMRPGATQLTVTPSAAKSHERPFAQRCRAPLAALVGCGGHAAAVDDLDEKLHGPKHVHYQLLLENYLMKSVFINGEAWI